MDYEVISLHATKGGDGYWEVSGHFWLAADMDADPEEADCLATGETAQKALGLAVLALSNQDAIAKALEETRKKYQQ